MTFRSLADIATGSGSARKLNVCVVSSEFVGPVKNGGIATATSGLLKQLAGDGHNVTLLYTLVEYGRPTSGDKPWQHWVDELAEQQITLKHIPHTGDYWSWREKSWRVKDAIAGGDFDLVYFNEHHGNGYYSLLAKRCGMRPFSQQLHCLITHGSIEWVFDINDQYASRAADLEMMGLERRSVELADLIIAPSGYLLKQYESYGWRLPAHVVQPYALFQNPQSVPASGAAPISELVFFGRLEARKGLWLFCEALDALGERLQGKTVTFLGRMTDTSGISSGLQIINRSSRWPCRIKLLHDFGQEEAIAYLREPGRLAVMPSLADNSPCVIYECMEAGIPFLTTSGSGADELIDQASWKDVMAEPTAPALTKALAAIFQNGAQFGKPRFDPKKNLATWSKWHAHVAKDPLAMTAKNTFDIAPVAQPSRPALIVVIDKGACPLSLMIDNLLSHIKRFGSRAAYMVLSARGGPLQQALYEILGGWSEKPPTIAFLDSRTLPEALRVITQSKFVFVADAEVEISTPFFAMAMSILEQGHPAALSCAVGLRSDKTSEIELDDLPTGDVPGLAALGYPIGGSIWAMTPQGLAHHLSALSFYDAVNDELQSSKNIGQQLLVRCRADGIPVHVMPILGGVETRPKPHSNDHNDRNEARAAAALNIQPSIYKGGAAWFAINAYGPRSDDSFSYRHYSRHLPGQHPLLSLSATSDADLPALAAALARPALALQLHAGNPDGGDGQNLLDVAKNAARFTPAVDLADLLRQGPVMEYGTSALPQPQQDKRKALRAPKAGPALQEAPNASADGTSIYLDGRRLKIDQNKIQSMADLRGDDPGRLFIFDVPLRGNSQLAVKAQSNGREPVSIRITLLDQATGGEIASDLLAMTHRQSAEIVLPLHELWGSAAIALELSGQGKAEVVIEATAG